jgi:hypothetical protein
MKIKEKKQIMNAMKELSFNTEFAEQFTKEMNERIQNKFSSEERDILLEGLFRFKTDAKFRKLVMKEYFKKD